MTLGDTIQGLRDKRGITQSDLANELGVSHSAVAMWETGKRDLNTKMVVRIANYFNVTCDYLLGSVIQDETVLKSPYSTMLYKAVNVSGLTMGEIAKRITLSGHKLHPSYIGKLISGKSEPASDETNEVLAKFLNIDSLEFRTLAWLEKIPSYVLEKIKDSG